MNSLGLGGVPEVILRLKAAASSRLLDKWLTLALALAIAFAAVWPQRFLELSPPCLWQRLGLVHECWGCGMTRALVHLIRGHWHAAVNLNPLVILVAPLLACLYGRFVWLSWAQRGELRRP
jgi:Protein of unknown function (DUF2752)